MKVLDSVLWLCSWFLFFKFFCSVRSCFLATTLDLDVSDGMGEHIQKTHESIHSGFDDLPGL